MKRLLVGIGAAAVGVLGALGLRRRRAAGSGPNRRGDGGGGLAGDREPRRPLPPVLTSAGAPHPAD